MHINNNIRRTVDVFCNSLDTIVYVDKRFYITATFSRWDFYSILPDKFVYMKKTAPYADAVTDCQKTNPLWAEGYVQYFGLWPKPPSASGYLSGTIQYFDQRPKPPSASRYLSGTWRVRPSRVCSAGGIHFRRGKSRISAPWQSSGLSAEIGIYFLNLNSKKSRRTFSTRWKRYPRTSGIPLYCYLFNLPEPLL